MFNSGQQNLTHVNGKIFLDRNPKAFGLVLDFLRNDQEEIKIEDPVLRNLFENELKFWGLKKKSEDAETPASLDDIEQVKVQLQAILEQEP